MAFLEFRQFTEIVQPLFQQNRDVCVRFSRVLKTCRSVTFHLNVLTFAMATDFHMSFLLTEDFFIVNTFIFRDRVSLVERNGRSAGQGQRGV